MTVYMTLGQHWIDQYLSGILLLHTLLGHNVSVTPKTEPTLNTLIHVLQEVAKGIYVPSKYFKPGPALRLSLITKSPSLAPGARYALVGLNASTARSQLVSVTTGGVVFEDPLWAILAAHAISKNLSVAIPIAKDNNELWKNVQLVAEAVMQGIYKPQHFLGGIEGFIPPGFSPQFALLFVNSDQVAPLRDRGVQSLKVTVPPKFFELFQFPGGSANR